MEILYKLSEKLNFYFYKYKFIIYLFFTLFLSLVVFKILNLIHAPNINDLSSAAYGVIIGKPHWRAYSNRLLGPYIVYFISEFGFTFNKSLKIFNLLMIFIQNLSLYFMLLSQTKKSYELSFKYIIFFSFILIGMQHYWSYTWDYIDIIVFTFFVWAIFEKRSTLFFIILFFIEIINRESALFIALYLIIDSYRFNFNHLRNIQNVSLLLSDKMKFKTGILLLVIGSIYTKIIRDYLFIESLIPGIGNDLAHKYLGNHFYLLSNLKHIFIWNITSLEIINSIFIFGVIIFFLINLPKFKELHLKAFILFICILCSIFIFGAINETRNFIILIPFLIFFHLDFYEKRV